MRKNKFIVKTLSVLTVLMIFLNTVAPAFACGPFWLEPVFVFEKRPAIDHREFVGGKLGVVLPTYTRSNLFVAYRYLTDAPLSAVEQQQINAYWEEKKRDYSEEKEDPNDPIIKWILARNQVTKELPPNYSQIDLKEAAYSFAGKLDKKYQGYLSYRNCKENAILVAAETLQNRIKNYGAENAEVKEWLKGQDTVFSNCERGENIPAAVADNAPDWLKNDRAYQIAAAYFYTEKLDEARNGFAAIATNQNSVWRDVSDYLVGRTLLRQASLSENSESEEKSIYAQAETHLKSVITKNTRYRADAQALLNLVKFRLHPEERLGELNASLAKTNPNNDLKQDLIDYVWLLDRYEGEKLNEIEEKNAPPEPQQTPSPVPTVSPVNSNSAVSNSSFSNTMTNSNISNRYMSGSSPVSNMSSMSNMSYSANSNMAPRALPTPQARDTMYYGWSEYKGYWGDTELDQTTVPPILIKDDLSDWLFNYHFTDEKAFAHAVEKWKASGKAHWLLSALSKAKPNYSQTAELMAAAEKIPVSSRAYATARYFLIDLQINQGKYAEAKANVESMLNNSSQSLPVQSRNLFLSERMMVADNLDDFLKYATRNAVGFVWSDGDLEDFSGTPDEKDSVNEERKWVSRRMFDEDAQKVFERQMPLTVLKDAALNPNLPDYLKRQLLITLWARAVVLDDQKILSLIAAPAKQYIPEAAAVIAQFESVRTPAQKRYAGIYSLLKVPAFDPHFKDGMGRVTPAAQIDNYRENWWCADEASKANDEKNKSQLAPVKFLTPAQLQTARDEKQKLEALGNAPPFLVKKTIEWANSAPRDARVPEALHLAVKTTRYGCYTENIGESSKSAHDLLHSRYPRSEWAKKTPYWFNN